MAYDFEVGNDSKVVAELMAKIRRDLNQKPKVKDYALGNGKSSHDLGVVDKRINNVSNRRGDHYSTYDALLKGMVTDEQMKKQIVEYYEVLGQKRTFLDLTIKSNMKEECIVTVLGVLPEYVDLMSNWWIGKEFNNYDGFEKLVRDFDTEMKRYGISGVIAKGYLKDSGRIISVGRVIRIS